MVRLYSSYQVRASRRYYSWTWTRLWHKTIMLWFSDRRDEGRHAWEDNLKRILHATTLLKSKTGEDRKKTSEYDISSG